MKIQWRFGFLAAFVVALFALFPQITVWTERGGDFNGVFASNDLDEPAYAAYLQALIDGRPRKNDPYSGRDETPENPQPESIFSIQFAAPYFVAIPARILGLNASQMFVGLLAIASFFTALAMFWLLAQMTEDNRLAAIGTLVIMFGGALASGNGVIREFLGGTAYPFLPFLRRYIPAVAFPFFFALFGFVWIALKSEIKRTKYVSSILAGLCFGFLVFSYFYLWTTAAAFLFALTIIWLVVRPENWKRNLPFLLLTDVIAFLFLLPYAYLLSNRAASTDAIQLLVFTHAPDLLRVPAIVCYVALLILALAIVLKFARIKQLSTIFLIAFAVVPFIVFNQQVITGRSLQPFHYEFYVVNYLVALSVVLTLTIFLKHIKLPKLYSTILLIVGISAVVWGYLEVKYTTKLLVYWNVERDEAMPISKRLVELAKENETLYGKNAVTLNLDYIQADNQPVVAPNAVLWARHQHVFAGVGWEENKTRYYQLLYYSGRDANRLRQDFKNGDIEAYMALFGWDRFNATLSVNARPLTVGEVEEEVRRYDAFYKNFSFAQAAAPTLSFVVVPKNGNWDLSNLERWYELDAGEDFGKFTLHKAKLKAAN
ncbi:MAG: hypothetical protein LH472_00045 [Pyrinomonadaceae bacterium]|nr:hypothetical protein [Pyrinomonadaceae bacterium]